MKMKKRTLVVVLVALVVVVAVLAGIKALQIKAMIDNGKKFVMPAETVTTATCPGDVAKAFGGGADFVMIGGMFAGHDESGGELVEREGKRYRQFYGMSSQAAMAKHAGGVAQYRAAEGKMVEVPYRGPIEETVRDILGGVRSACTYVGALALRELTKRTTFIRVLELENRTFSAPPDKPCR